MGRDSGPLVGAVPGEPAAAGAVSVLRDWRVGSGLRRNQPPRCRDLEREEGGAEERLGGAGRVQDPFGSPAWLRGAQTPSPLRWPIAAGASPLCGWSPGSLWFGAGSGQRSSHHPPQPGRVSVSVRVRVPPCALHPAGPGSPRVAPGRAAFVAGPRGSLPQHGHAVTLASPESQLRLGHGARSHRTRGRVQLPAVFRESSCSSCGTFSVTAWEQCFKSSERARRATAVSVIFSAI